MDALAHLDVPDGVQDGELLLHEVGVVLFLKDEQVAVPLGFQQQSVSRRPVVQLLVDLGQDRAALGVRAGFHQVLVVVHHHNSQHGAGGGVGLLQLVGLGGVHPVGGGHQVLLAAPALGPDETAVHPEAAAVHHHPLGALLLPLQQPLGGEVRHGVLHLHLKQVLPHAGQLEEILIAPDDLPGVGAEDHDGQGRVDEGGFAGGIHAAGHAVNVLQNPLAALFVHLGRVDVQRHRGKALRQGQGPAHHDGSQGKGHQTQEVQL